MSEPEFNPEPLDEDCEWARPAPSTCSSHDWDFVRSVTGRQHDGQEVTIDLMRCRQCGEEEWD